MTELILQSFLSQKGSWLPREASLHLLLATPQSSILRDMSLDVDFSPHRLLLRITHPLKTILIQGESQRSSVTTTAISPQLKLCSPLRATCAGSEDKVREVGAVD